MSRYLTIDCHAQMEYEYEDETLPVAAPGAQALRAGPGGRRGGGTEPLPVPGAKTIPRPPTVMLEASGQRPTDSARFSVGGVRTIELDENPVTAQVSIDPSALSRVKEVIDVASASRREQSSASEPIAAPGAAIQVVLDDIRLTPLGENGGYFYNLYLNMPAAADITSLDGNNLLGGIGSFAILSALHHTMQAHDHARGAKSVQSGGARLMFSASRLLAGVPLERLNEVTVSFVRFSGDRAPTGVVITIGELRMEISNDGLE
jgi:tyrosinase